MGTAFIHPNLQRRCECKTRFATYQEARDHETPGMKIISCCVCAGFHHSSHNGTNVAQPMLSPDEIVEMFK